MSINHWLESLSQANFSNGKWVIQDEDFSKRQDSVRPSIILRQIEELKVTLCNWVDEYNEHCSIHRRISLIREEIGVAPTDAVESGVTPIDGVTPMDGVESDHDQSGMALKLTFLLGRTKAVASLGVNTISFQVYTIVHFRPQGVINFFFIPDKEQLGCTHWLEKYSKSKFTVDEIGQIMLEELVKAWSQNQKT